MCGIAGILSPNVSAYYSLIEEMVNSLKQRGPDGSGIGTFDICLLGHTRLSIIDHMTGHQPMRSALTTKTIVFNGEIYGFQKIREKISSYPFATSSDTEVILALYEEKGEECLDILPGMFAFAIWDDTKKILFAARDRFGEKPFYYALGKSGEFIFASEIKAILSTGLVEPELDTDSLEHYLKYLYINPRKTIYSNIYPLPPGHFLIWSAGSISIHRYWTPIFSYKDLEIEKSISVFRSLLQQAVTDQMVADVPVGVFLSGGLDSSTIVALASSQTQNLLTFSFGFGDAINELPYALSISEQYCTNHRELTPDRFSLRDLLMRMAEVYDEPFADSSNIPTYLISELARNYVKVVLTGDGADELLGGYTGWYRPLLHCTHKSDSSIKEHLIRLAARIAVNLSDLVGTKSLGIESIQYMRYRSVKEMYLDKTPLFSDRELQRLCLFDLKKQKYEPDLNWQSKNDVNDALLMDIGNYLPGDILVKTDRASMAHGLELRAPFLDFKVASFCLSLPSHLKITEEEDKILLRRAFEHEWTEMVRKKEKQGFGAPFHLWLKDEGVKTLIKQYLQDPKALIFSYISFEQVQIILKGCSYQIWSLLVLAIWFEKNMKSHLGAMN